MQIIRMVLASAAMLAIFGGANFYVARRMHGWLNIIFPNINTKIYIGAYVFLALSMFLGFFPFPSGVKTIFNWLGVHFYSFFIYLLVFLLLADLIILIGSLIKLVPSPVPQSVLFYKGFTAIILTIGVVGFGLFNAAQFKIVSYELEVKDESLSGMTIVLISDSHLGAVNSFENNLERIVEEINALTPDIVCLAGDIFNDDFNLIRDPERASALLSSINSTYGVFACLGNHDGGSTLPEMKSFLEESNVTLLNDEYVILGERVALFGRLDAHPIGGFGGLERRDISDVIARVSEDFPVIVMDHNPAHIKEYGSETALLLFGHAHNGQMFPGMFITDAINVIGYGHYQEDENSPHVIVTSGISTWGPPIRVGTHNEIAVIYLK
jgi:hypothetical protein